MSLDIKSADIEFLIAEIQKSGKNYDVNMITRAYDFANEAHNGQLRRSGEPYICHPVSVAVILVRLGMDSESIASALLHDVVEDTGVELNEIKKLFGENVMHLVDGVTKLGNLPYVSHEAQQAENLRKMLLAMNEDIRVIIIKLADRLHNMNTLEYMSEQKQRDISLETLEVYAPIAHRLGIRALKEDLEDLAIQHLDPVAYREIEDALKLQKDIREKVLNDIKEKIKNRLSEVLSDVYIEGRVKSVNGIYRKMYMHNKTFEEIYDIYAIRVIVDTVTDCYNVLGIVHDMFGSIPGRFKDYISTPKPNNYQSLHTTVLTRQQIPFEIQIRTWEMHHTAEYGIAAHWKYKLGINKNDDADMRERLEWIRNLLEVQSESDDATEIMRTIKTDLGPEDVFAVTPKGDVKSLPVHSTVIDFAYAIHTAVGNKMIGAKVNGRIVPIDYELNTGDVVEILTTSAEHHGPSRDWLKIVRTSSAKSKIRSWFKKERRAENLIEGKAEVEREFSRSGIRSYGKELEDFILEIAKRNHCETMDDFYVSIGYGGISLGRIMPRIKEEYNRIEKEKKPQELVSLISTKGTTGKSPDGVIVEGIDNCLIKLSRCCNPIPGDDIIGFITRGHGVSVHKRNCVNVPVDIEQSAEPNRWIKTYWDKTKSEKFKCGLRIYSLNEDGMLALITTTLANLRVSIHAVMAREIKGGQSEIALTLGVENIEHLKSIVEKLSSLNGVLSVERYNG